MPEHPSSFDRRTLLAGTAAAGAVGLLGLNPAGAAKSTQKEHKMAATECRNPPVPSRSFEG